MSYYDSLYRQGIEIEEYMSPKRKEKLKDEARKELLDSLLLEKGYIYDENSYKFIKKDD